MIVRKCFWKWQFARLLKAHITIDEGPLKNALIQSEIKDWMEGDNAPWHSYSPSEALMIFLNEG